MLLQEQTLFYPFSHIFSELSLKGVLGEVVIFYKKIQTKGKLETRKEDNAVFYFKQRKEQVL